MGLDKSQSSQEKEGQANNSAAGGMRKTIVQTLKKFADVVRGAWKRTSIEKNDEYRQLFLAPDISQARLVIFWLAVVVALFAIGDYMFFSFSLTFFALTALRVGLIFYSAFQFRYIHQVKNYSSYYYLLSWRFF
ncbi:MAG: hypothetical protein M1167_03825 [Chloroflexi bacterium]|nr:hypothetical protein [Chloroflexota bacterium]